MAKLKITTLIIGDEGDINGVYHSVKTTKKEIEKDLVNQVLEDDDYDEDDIKYLKSIKKMKNYFEICFLTTKTIEL